MSGACSPGCLECDPAGYSWTSERRTSPYSAQPGKLTNERYSLEENPLDAV